jgi:broad specificity phosphatase PhoE
MPTGASARDGLLHAGEMNPPQVWLVRHGETDWSAAGQHTGRTDLALNSSGRRAAESLGPTLDGIAVTAAFTSPLKRAVETCRLAGFGDGAIVLPDLAEWSYGDYEGRTTASIRESRPDWTLWRDGCPGGESAADVGARADRVIARLRDAEGNVVLFGHGHALRVLAARWVGLPAEDGALLALDTAAVSQLGWEREQAVVRRWNVTKSEPAATSRRR